MSKYHTSSHSKYLLKAHFVFVVKFRQKILNQFGDFIKAVFLDVAEKYDFIIDIMEVDKDHIHVLVDYKPKQNIAYIAQALKSISTNRLWECRSKELKKHIWSSGKFWSEGYFACSTGDASTETIKQYIENQG